MEPAFSLVVIWPVAAMEAKTHGWPEIEPAHLLMSALRFVELAPPSLEQLAKATGAPAEVVQAHEALSACFRDDLGFEIPQTTTRLYEALQRQGIARPDPTPGMLHRSARTKELFFHAQQETARKGRQRLEAADLILYLVQHPDEWVKLAIEKVGPVRVSKEEVALPTEGRWGSILEELSVDGAPAVPHKPAQIVVEEYLSSGKSRPLLLVYHQACPAKELLRSMVGKVKDKQGVLRFVSVDTNGLLKHLQQEQSMSVQRLLAELQQLESTLLFWDNLQLMLTGSELEAARTEDLLEWLLGKHEKLVLALPEASVEKVLRSYPRLRTGVHTVHLQPVPQEVMRAV